MWWHIGVTRPGQDAKAAKAARNSRYLVYRPIMPARSVSYGRVIPSAKSMFPRLFFVADPFRQGWRYLESCAGMRGYAPLFSMNGLHPTINDEGQEWRRIKEKERELWDIRPCGFAVGDEVTTPIKLNDGTSADLLGIIERLDDAARACILVSILGRLTRFDVPLSQIAATGRRATSSDRISLQGGAAR